MAGGSWSLVRKPDIEGRPVRWPREIGALFDRRELVGQFRLSTSHVELPGGWREAKLGSWILAYDPALPVLRIVASGTPMGWLLGQPITPEGVLLSSDLEVSVDQADPDGLERTIHWFAGRYLAMWLAPGSERIYLDASGSIGVVYSPSQRVVASSLFLIPYQDSRDDRLALVNERGRYPIDPHLFFGLTVRDSVDWLLPNHYLDLDTWKPIRYWPTGEIETTSDVEDTLETIAGRLTASIRALVEAGPIQMALTAGNDSRVLLACSKEFLEDIEFVTMAFPDHAGRTDVSVARGLARDLKLRHRVVPWRRSLPADIARLLFRTGCVAALDARCQEGVATMASMDSRRPYVSAVFGEVARMPAIASFGPNPEPVTIEKMLAWRQAPVWPELVERGTRWLEELPIKNAHGVFDMRAIEFRFGGWCGPLTYGYPEGQAHTVYPYSDRAVLEAMLSLPLEYRLLNQFVPDILERQWPELLRHPVNQATNGWYGVYRKARRFAKRTLRR